MTMARTRAALVVAALLAGCSAGSPPPSGTAPAGGSPPASGIEACGPVDLRSPSGVPVDLNGEWGGVALGGHDWFSTPGTGERTFIQQIGDCVWMSISDDQFRANPKPNESLMAVYVGKIHPDFSVTGDLVTLLRYIDPFTYGTQSITAEVRLRIEFDANGRIQMVEDRVWGVPGPRCPNPEFWCPEPTMLRQLVAEPGPSPS